MCVVIPKTKITNLFLSNLIIRDVFVFCLSFIAKIHVTINEVHFPTFPQLNVQQNEEKKWYGLYTEMLLSTDNTLTAMYCLENVSSIK